MDGVRMTGARVIEITNCRPHGRITACLGRKLLNSYQGLAPEALLRQRLYPPTYGSSISAAGVDRLRHAAHSRPLIAVSKLHVDKEPQ
jgi:hypothetical protein